MTILKASIGGFGFLFLYLLGVAVWAFVYAARRNVALGRGFFPSIAPVVVPLAVLFFVGGALLTRHWLK